MNYQPYSAALQNKLNGYTPSSRRGEDSLLKGDYYNIVNNCLDLARNSPAAKSIIKATEDYVGGNGLTSNKGNPTALAVWDDWAAKPVDISGTKSFSQVFRDIVSSYCSSGDVLLTTPINPFSDETEVSLRLELTSGSRVVTPNEYTSKKDPNGCVVKFGVAYLEGVEFGYYVLEDTELNALDKKNKDNFKFIQKYDSVTGRLNAILIRRPTGMAAEQTRGLSILTTVVQPIRDLDDLIVSAIQGSRNKAHLSVVLTSDQIETAYGGAGAIDSEGNLIEAPSSTGEAQIIGELPDGAIMTAPSGTKAQAINSSGDIDRDALILRTMRLIGAGVGYPYEILFKDFSQTNFSSGKLAFDSFFRDTEFQTNQLIQVFKEINKWIQIEAYLKGFGVDDLSQIDIDLIGSQNYVDSDPGKNSKAETTRISNNTATASRILAQKGIQYNDILLEKVQEFKEAQAMAVKYDVPLSVLINQNEIESIETQVETQIEIDESEED